MQGERRQETGERRTENGERFHEHDGLSGRQGKKIVITSLFPVSVLPAPCPMPQAYTTLLFSN
jgi:hypothetical protein